MGTDEGAQAVPTDVREELCHDPDIEFVVAFGSRSTDASRPASDLDIAVKFSDTLASHDRFRKRCRLSGRLQGTDVPQVDLADIADLSLEFAHAAVNGELLCGDTAAFRAFREEIESEFEDRKDEIEQQHRRRIRRIAEDGFHNGG